MPKQIETIRWKTFSFALFSNPWLRFLMPRYRIIAMVSVVEKNHQGVHMKMKYLVDPKTDNFVKYYLDNPNFYIVVCVVLIFQD